MSTVSEQQLSKRAQKEKIRERYRGINPDVLTVIPAKQQENIFKTDADKRVAVYARVSTDDPNQTSSYELQRNHYEDMVRHHPNWTLVNIYADEGISGTSLNHRESFKQMIDDCEKGMIDLIITKSVARFARNIEDCIHYTRHLKRKAHPIGVLFENENIYTLNPDSEMQLSFVATMAQEESHTKSVVMNSSIEMRFKRGIFLTPVLLGYDHNEDGQLVINEEEAKTVKIIFLMYLSGKNCSYIANKLTEYGRKTKLGNTVWAPGTIYQILKNERYCGDVLAHKTFTPDYLTHKSVKNEEDRPQYYQEDHHEAIISRNDFHAVQALLDQNKFGCKKLLPELKVIDEGVLKGFVQINPFWLGFTESDYYNACHSVLTDEDYMNPTILVRHEKGEFDFTEYEVTRGQFASDRDKISVMLTGKYIRFSMAAIHKLADIKYVELLYHPLYQILVVRKSDPKNPHAVQWITNSEIKPSSKNVNAESFASLIYRMCGWNASFQYMLRGCIKEKEGQRLLMFYSDEPEVRIEKAQLKYLLQNTDESMRKKYITAFPTEWTKAFGLKYDEELGKAISVFNPDIEWKSTQQGVISNKADFEIRMADEYIEELEKLLEGMELNGAGTEDSNEISE